MRKRQVEVVWLYSCGWGTSPNGNQPVGWIYTSSWEATYCSLRELAAVNFLVFLCVWLSFLNCMFIMYIACTQFWEASLLHVSWQTEIALLSQRLWARGEDLWQASPPPGFLDDYTRSRLFWFCVSMCVCFVTLRTVHIYQLALLCTRHPYISVSVFFVCVCALSLPEGTDCQKRGGQADLLFCLLSGHSSEHWPSPKLKPPATHWTQHSDAPTGMQWHWIICACQFVGNEKDRRKWPCMLKSTMVVSVHCWTVEGCFSICNWIVWRTSEAKASQD